MFNLQKKKKKLQAVSRQKDISFSKPHLTLAFGRAGNRGEGKAKSMLKSIIAYMNYFVANIIDLNSQTV